MEVHVNVVDSSDRISLSIILRLCLKLITNVLTVDENSQDTRSLHKTTKISLFYWCNQILFFLTVLYIYGTRYLMI